MRFLLEYLEVPFEDRRYTGLEQWQQEKQAFQDNPIAQTPFLKDGDRYVFESGAIPIYLANRTNRKDLLGSTAEEQVAMA